MRKLLLLLLFTSCIKPCTPPPTPICIPESWREEANEESTLCNLSWWEDFHDPILTELILLALQNNQDLEVARARIDEYYALFRVVSSELFPTITGELSYSRFQNSFAVPSAIQPQDTIQIFGTSPDRYFSDYYGAINATWEIDLWGRIRSRSVAAYSDFIGTIEARRALLITIVSSVARSYIQLRGLDNDQKIAERTLASRENSLKLAKTRFDIGETSEIEVRQAESQVNSAAISLLQIKREIPQVENLISTLIGECPHEILRGRALVEITPPSTIPAGLPSELLLRRPDIKAAEMAVYATEARITEARALYFPQIGLTGAFGSESDQLATFLTGPAQFWQYGISAIQTLFDAKRTYYRVQAAKAMAEQALASYRQTVLDAFRDVNDSLTEVRRNRELVQEHRTQVKVLEDYLNLSKMRYDEGETDYLTVLDAERTFFRSQLDYSAAEVDLLNSIIRLYSALGGGWVIQAEEISNTPLLPN